MNRRHESVTVKDFIKLYNEGNIILRPEYQSGVRWNKDKQSLLIRSILDNKSISAFVFHEKCYIGNPLKMDTVDGQQRATSILLFMQGELKVGNSYFADLTDEQVSSFLGYKLLFELVEGTREEIIELFLLLQQGVPLNAQEKRQAKLNSKACPYHKELIKHPLMDRLPRRGKSRTFVQDIADKLLYIVVYPNARVDNKNITDIWDDEELDFEKHAKEATWLADFINDAFDDESIQKLLGNVFFIDVVKMLLRLKNKEYNMGTVKQLIAPFVVAFATERRLNNRSEAATSYNEHFEYAPLDVKNAKERVNILEIEFLKTFPHTCMVENFEMPNVTITPR